mgnify:CR=1 FL=1
MSPLSSWARSLSPESSPSFVTSNSIYSTDTTSTEPIPGYAAGHRGRSSTGGYSSATEPIRGYAVGRRRSSTGGYSSATEPITEPSSKRRRSLGGSPIQIRSEEEANLLQASERYKIQEARRRGIEREEIKTGAEGLLRLKYGNFGYILKRAVKRSSKSAVLKQLAAFARKNKKHANKCLLYKEYIRCI